MNTSDYKSLEVWRKSILLCKEVYLLTRKLPKEETYVLSDQMRRAAISIASNIAEGQGRESKKVFLKFLSISRGSLCELETQCIIAIEIGLLNNEDVSEILSLCSEIGKMIRALANYLSKQLEMNN
ncbi:four helix bundle protein [Bacteroides caecigallinarum]|uniref:four helix bundle protein n=1 Tax=Bacteroides caecigallinarum TaxID=1411144 RepID=UPI001F1B919B|nr:four helix bundle protein [Bacteroides caecigallinarum]MCF2594435.1 four helix bundle protein [Bacteroides caecigallinarum]